MHRKAQQNGSILPRERKTTIESQLALTIGKVCEMNRKLESATKTNELVVQHLVSIETLLRAQLEEQKNTSEAILQLGSILSLLEKRSNTPDSDSY